MHGTGPIGPGHAYHAVGKSSEMDVTGLKGPVLVFTYVLEVRTEGTYRKVRFDLKVRTHRSGPYLSYVSIGKVPGLKGPDLTVGKSHTDRYVRDGP